MKSQIQPCSNHVIMICNNICFCEKCNKTLYTHQLTFIQFILNGKMLLYGLDTQNHFENIKPNLNVNTLKS